MFFDGFCLHILDHQKQIFLSIFFYQIFEDSKFPSIKILHYMIFHNIGRDVKLN